MGKTVAHKTVFCSVRTLLKKGLIVPARDEGTPQHCGRSLELFYQQSGLWEISRYRGDADQRLRARVIASMLEPDVESVLDVGCGNGFITGHLRAARVVGLDPSKEALKHVQGEAVHGWSDSLPFSSKSFDAIVCTEVLEHLADDVYAATLREISRVARSEILIGVPYDQDLRLGMTVCGDCAHEYHVDLHCRRFKSPEQVEKHFPGFSIRATAYVGRTTRIRSRAYRRLKYWLVGPTERSEMAQCPRCNSCRSTTRSSAPSSLARWVFKRMSWRMPVEELAHWMLVLLVARK